MTGSIKAARDITEKTKGCILDFQPCGRSSRDYRMEKLKLLTEHERDFSFWTTVKYISLG